VVYLDWYVLDGFVNIFDVSDGIVKIRHRYLVPVSCYLRETARDVLQTMRCDYSTRPFLGTRLARPRNTVQFCPLEDTAAPLGGEVLPRWLTQPPWSVQTASVAASTTLVDSFPFFVFFMGTHMFVVLSGHSCSDCDAVRGEEEVEKGRNGQQHGNVLQQRGMNFDICRLHLCGIRHARRCSNNAVANSTA
jgi:hypothetical protein